MARKDTIRWLAEKFWRWDVVVLGSTLIYGFGVGAMYADDYVIAHCFYFLSVAWLTAKVLTWEETRAHKNRKGISIAVLLLGVFGLLLSEGWVHHRRHFMQPEKPAPIALNPVPAPPTLAVGRDFDLFQQEGKVTKVPKSLIPCSFSSAPHHTAKEPWLVLDATRYQFRQWPDRIDLMFQAEVTNRGTPSIVKDWELCLALPDSRIAHVHADDMPSDASLLQPIGHGRVVAGWITFRLGKDFIPTEKVFETLSNIEGGLRCRDYLDHPSSLTFSTTPD